MKINKETNPERSGVYYASFGNNELNCYYDVDNDTWHDSYQKLATYTKKPNFWAEPGTKLSLAKVYLLQRQIDNLTEEKKSAFVSTKKEAFKEVKAIKTVKAITNEFGVPSKELYFAMQQVIQKELRMFLNKDEREKLNIPPKPERPDDYSEEYEEELRDWDYNRFCIVWNHIKNEPNEE